MIGVTFFVFLLLVIAVIMTILNLAKGKPDLGYSILVILLALMVEFGFLAGWIHR